MKLTSVILIIGLISCTPIDQTKNSISEEESSKLIDRWLELWASYDIDLLGEIFWNNPALTYFSSEKEGLIRGFENLIPHHEGFGFVSGGKVPEKSLWLEALDFTNHGDVVVVNAIWFFGNRSELNPQNGPVTFVLVRTDDQLVRIAHTHFANYN